MDKVEKLTLMMMMTNGWRGKGTKRVKGPSVSLDANILPINPLLFRSSFLLSHSLITTALVKTLITVRMTKVVPAGSYSSSRWQNYLLFEREALTWSPEIKMSKNLLESKQNTLTSWPQQTARIWCFANFSLVLKLTRHVSSEPLLADPGPQHPWSCANETFLGWTDQAK